MKFIVVFVILIILVSVGFYVKGRFFKKDAPIISIVLLLKDASQITTIEVSAIMKKVFNVELSEEEKEEGFIVNTSPTMIVNIKSKQKFFIIHNFPNPYFENMDDVASIIRDVRLREVLNNHKSWLSVDWLGSYSDDSFQKIYQDLGKVTTEFIDDNVLAIYLPQFNICNVINENTKEKLLSDNPIEKLKENDYMPVVEIGADDPRMKQAVEEARKRWPEFVEEFNRSKDKNDFSVKAPLSDGDSTEFIWIDVTEIQNNIIRGELGNEPVNLDNLRLGDSVEVEVDDLNDWCYFKDGELIGGFTVKILAEETTK